jgi:hypothetical protein
MKNNLISTHINTRNKIESVLIKLGEKNVEGKRELLEAKLYLYTYTKLIKALNQL